MCLRRKKKGKSKVLCRGFCLRDSEAEQKALQFLHIYCSNVNSYSSAPELNRPNPPDITLYRRTDPFSLFMDPPLQHSVKAQREEGMLEWRSQKLKYME